MAAAAVQSTPNHTLDTSCILQKVTSNPNTNCYNTIYTGTRDINAAPGIFTGTRAVTTAPAQFGQGKRAIGVIANQGDVVTMVTDLPYQLRSRHIPTSSPGRKGVRPMHTSTLSIPTQAHTDYTTTVQHVHGGRKDLSSPEKRVAFPSQHTSQFIIGKGADDWNTYYSQQFNNAPDITPAYKLHLPSQHNKLNMNEGGNIKHVMTLKHRDQGSHGYWSQYNRVHNKLGAMLGPGEERERKTRVAFNPITGQEKGSAWSAENKRTSGNRVLYNGSRTDCNKRPHFVLG